MKTTTQLNTKWTCPNAKSGKFYWPKLVMILHLLVAIILVQIDWIQIRPEKRRTELDSYCLSEKFWHCVHGVGISEMKGEKDFEILFQMTIQKGTDGMHYSFLLRDIEKTNIADPDQTRQNVASDQGLRGFL